MFNYEITLKATRLKANIIGVVQVQYYKFGAVISDWSLHHELLDGEEHKTSSVKPFD